MKGITPVIAVILLLLITIAMVGFAFVWFGRIAGAATNATQQQLESQLSQQAKRVSIDNLNAAQSNVTFRNTGTATIAGSEISVYAGGTLVTCIWSPPSAVVAPGATMSCDWSGSACTANTLVRVTAPGGADESTC